MPFQTVDLTDGVTISIGSRIYPIKQFAFSTNEMLDQVAYVGQSWNKWLGNTKTIMPAEITLTPYGQAMLQEYLANGQCVDVTFVYVYNPPPVILVSSRRKRPGNTRIQRVQAKRKVLGLNQDGKCCALKTRRASLAFRQAEQQWCNGKRAEQPLAREFERVSPRVARKQAKDARRFYRSFGLLKDDANFLDFSDYMTHEIVRTFALPSSVMGVVDQDLAHVFAISPDEIKEQYNG